MESPQHVADVVAREPYTTSTPGLARTSLSAYTYPSYSSRPTIDPAPNASSVLAYTSSASASNASPSHYTPSSTFDTTGQIAPPGVKPRVTATLWEDEGSLCFQVEAKGVCVARREDNHMINGTKLLNVAGMTRGRRDGILKAEKTRHVVKIGPMHLKGAWIPFERALEFANKERITEQLYPLFVHDIGALLYHPSNQTRASVRMTAASPPAWRSGQPPNLDQHHSKNSPDNAVTPLPSKPSSGRPGTDRAHTFPTPPTSASSIMGMGADSASTYQWGPHPSQQPLSIDVGICNRSLPTTPASTPPGTDQQSYFAANESSYDTTRPDYSFCVRQVVEKMTQSLGDVVRPETSGNSSRIVDTELNPQSPRGDPSVDEEMAARVTPVPMRMPTATFDVNATHERDQPHLDLLSANASPSTDTQSATEASGSLESLDSSSDDDIDMDSRKQRIIDRIMIDFYKLFDTTAGVTQRGAHDGSGYEQLSADFILSTSSNGEGLQEQAGKRKAKDRDGNEDSGDETQKPTKRPKAGNDEAEPERRLACPYFKRNPKRYRNAHPCLGPGWNSIHRVKEHLYRRHQLPPQCSRCCQAFDSDSKLKEHSRLPNGCELRSEEALEGFDKDQERRLRSRKKGALGDNRDDQWKEMYLVLFPDTLLPEIPSSHYDYEEDSKQDANPSPTSAGFARYEAYLSRELPRSVRRELEIAMERELGPIEDRLKSQLEVIVRNCQERLFKMYQDAAQQKDESGDTDQAENDVARGLEPPIPVDGISTFLSGPTAEDDLAAYHVPPAVSLQLWDDFIGCPSLEGGVPSDSAYESMPLDPSWVPPSFDFESTFVPGGMPTWVNDQNPSADYMPTQEECAHLLPDKDIGKLKS